MSEQLYERFLSGDNLTITELIELRLWLRRKQIAAKVVEDTHELELRISDIQYVNQEIKELGGPAE